MEEEQIYESLDRVSHVFRNYLYNLLKVLKENCKEKLLSVILYGSVARGKWNKDSDIDLFLLFSDDTSDARKLNKEVIRLTAFFEKENQVINEDGVELFCPIQEIALKMEDLNNFRTLYYDIAMDGIILFDRNQTGLKFIKKIKNRIEEKGLKRVFISDNDFYWERKDIKFGEIVEL